MNLSGKCFSTVWNVNPDYNWNRESTDTAALSAHCPERKSTRRLLSFSISTRVKGWLLLQQRESTFAKSFCYIKSKSNNSANLLAGSTDSGLTSLVSEDQHRAPTWCQRPSCCKASAAAPITETIAWQNFVHHNLSLSYRIFNPSTSRVQTSGHFWTYVLIVATDGPRVIRFCLCQ